MKKILLILAIFAGIFNTYAQKMDYFELKDGILQMGKKISGTGLYFTGDTQLLHHDYIEIYTDKTSKEYIIRILVETMVGEPRIFYNKSKLFVKLSKDNTLQIEPIWRNHTPYAEGLDWKSSGTNTCKSEAYYLVSEEDMNLICGKKKVNVTLPLLTVSTTGEQEVFYWSIKMDGKAIKKIVNIKEKKVDKYFARAAKK